MPITRLGDYDPVRAKARRVKLVFGSDNAADAEHDSTAARLPKGFSDSTMVYGSGAFQDVQQRVAGSRNYMRTGHNPAGEGRGRFLVEQAPAEEMDISGSGAALAKAVQPHLQPMGLSREDVLNMIRKELANLKGPPPAQDPPLDEDDLDDLNLPPDVKDDIKKAPENVKKRILDNLSRSMSLSISRGRSMANERDVSPPSGVTPALNHSAPIVAEEHKKAIAEQIERARPTLGAQCRRR